MTDHRRFQRFSFAGSVDLRDESGQVLCRGGLCDLSLRGLLVDGVNDVSTLARVRTAAVQLGGDISVEMHVALAHKEQGRAGFVCEKIDMDHFAQLKRVVELNLGDADVLERELTQLG